MDGIIPSAISLRRVYSVIWVSGSSCLLDTSDFAHNITSGVMDIDHQSHMNALEEKLLQRTASDFEVAAPVVCPHINIRIPALRF